MKNCDICGKNTWASLFNTVDRVYPINRGFRVIQCKRCESLFLIPQLSVKELKEHYPQVYYEFIAPIDFGTKNSFLASIKYKLKEKVLFYYYNYPFSIKNKSILIEKLLLFPLKFYFSRPGNIFIPPDGKGKMLDIGCGMGGTLDRFKKLGWETYGVEPDKYAAEHVKRANHNITCGTLLDTDFPSDFFDIVLLRQVLEHLNNPVEIFKEIKRIVKPKGKIYLSVPISNNLFFKIFKSRWYSLDSPRHLWIPSTKAIKILCYKTGMKVNKLNYKSGGEILGSIQYLVNDLMQERIYLIDDKKNKIYRNKFLMKGISPFEFILEKFNLTGTVELEITKE
ncbi:MAG: class I SAM-dependent methyltransferase [bacterium]|nr:class I SAM-dependent methyltransferase [bacterium]